MRRVFHSVDSRHSEHTEDRIPSSMVYAWKVQLAFSKSVSSTDKTEGSVEKFEQWKLLFSARTVQPGIGGQCSRFKRKIEQGLQWQLQTTKV